MVALYGCGSQESNLNQSSNFTETRIALDAVHQKTLETLPTPPPDVLARQEPFPFTATATFARVTRTYSFYNSAGTFRQEPTSGQAPQIWNPSVEHFSAIFSGVNCDTFVDGLPSQMLEEDGVRLTLANDVTGDTFFLEGLTKPSGANVTFTVDESNSTSDGKNYRQDYSGVARFNSGWTAAFSKSSIVSQSQIGNTYTQSSFSRVNLVQPIASPKTITISNTTSSHTSNNTTLDFDISAVNTTVQGWGVQVEKDNQIIKTLNPTTDFRGPGIGTGSNPIHVSLNWDGLADNNQAVTGNITWVMTANATTFVPGGTLNDGVNSVQARLNDNLDSSELTVTEIKADEAQPFLDEEGNIVPNPNLYYSQNPSVQQILVLAGDPTSTGAASISARATSGKVKELSLTLNRTGQNREIYDIRIVDPEHPDQILSDVRALEFAQGASTASIVLPVRLGTRVHRFPYLKVQTKNTTRLPARTWQDAKHVQFQPVYYSPIGPALTPFSQSQPLGDRALRLAWELGEGCQTDQEVRNKVVERLGPWLIAHHFIYVPGAIHYELDGTTKLSEREIFDFKSFAQHMDDADLTSNYFYGDCHDVSLTVAMACAAVGVEQNLMAFFPGNPQPGKPDLAFFTNPIRVFAELTVGDISLINSTAQPPTFTAWNFPQHQCNFYGGQNWDGLGQLQSGPTLSALLVNDYLDAFLNHNQTLGLQQDYFITPHIWVEFHNEFGRLRPERITYPDPRVDSPIKLTGIDQ